MQSELCAQQGYKTVWKRKDVWWEWGELLEFTSSKLNVILICYYLYLFKGLPQFIIIVFDSAVNVEEIHVMFQGGFVGKVWLPSLCPSPPSPPSPPFPPFPSFPSPHSPLS
jgi:hypothetical protein